MKKKTAIIASLAAILISGSTAFAQDYDQNITAIFGAGNPNGGWTAETDNGIQLALRAKNRETASTANASGVYSEPVGLQAPANNRARWNWEFSIDSGAVNLDAYDYYLAIDTDTSVGINHLAVDALAFFADDSYGNASTLNGQGVEGSAATYASLYNIAQQSQNIVFYGLNPLADATYDYELYAVQKGKGENGHKLASVSITVVVGTGGASVEQLVNACATGVSNHGEYVHCVKDLVKYLKAGDVISKKEGHELVKAASKSKIGK